MLSISLRSSPPGCSCRTSLPLPELWLTLRPRLSSRPVTLMVMARLELMVRQMTIIPLRFPHFKFHFKVQSSWMMKLPSPFVSLQSLLPWSRTKWKSWPTSHFTSLTTLKGTTWAEIKPSTLLLLFPLTLLSLSSTLHNTFIHKTKLAPPPCSPLRCPR